eukprot:5056555-Prorocentrum_lima.AAC.1
MSHSSFIAAKWATGAWATGVRKRSSDPASGGKKASAAGRGEPNGPSKGLSLIHISEPTRLDVI